MLNDELTSLLKSKGASLIGFADLTVLNPDFRDGFPYGISIAVALKPEIVLEITDGPTKSYVEECLRADAILNNLGQLAVKFLTEKGFQARQQATTNTNGTEYPPNLTTRLPHKTVATRAGLGWIGKCALIITREFGSAIRLGSILTDVNLPCGAPIDISDCGDCTDCVSVCPAGIITGKEWHVGIERYTLADVFVCRKTARELLTKRTGGEIMGRTFCGMCIVACPWTQKYLERAS